MNPNPCLLFVDDDDDFRVIASRELRQLATTHSIRVELAAGGAEGLEKLEEVVDGGSVLVISDYRMPQMNGLEFLQSVRAKYPRSAVRFVVLTSMEQSELAQQSFQLGADQFIMKPLDLNQLRQELAAAVTTWLTGLSSAGQSRRPAKRPTTNMA